MRVPQKSEKNSEPEKNNEILKILALTYSNETKWQTV